MRTILLSITLLTLFAATLGVVWWVAATSPQGHGIDAVGGVDEDAAADLGQLPPEVTSGPEAAATSQRLGFVSLAGRVLVSRPGADLAEPFPGVEVRLARANDLAFDDTMAAARSGSEGQLVLADVPAGRYQVLAFAPGFEPLWLDGVEVTAEGANAPLLLHFGVDAATLSSSSAESPGGEVAGALSEGELDVFEELSLEEGVVAAFPGGDVQVFSTGEAVQLPFIQLSGTNGEFDIVSFSGEGSTWSAALHRPTSRPSSPERETDPNQPAPGKAIIRGEATDARTGEPLSGANLRLVGLEVNRTVGADGEGRFRFEDIEPGEYAVMLDGLTRGSLFSPSPSNVILTIGADQVLNVQLRASRALRISGVVEGGQAEGVGILEGDRIVSYGGLPVHELAAPA